MSQVLREWWQFVRRPNLEFRKTEGLNRAFLFLLVWQCLLSVVSLLLAALVIPDFEKLSVEDPLKRFQDGFTLIFVVIGLAFLEELLFRLPLAQFRVRYLLPSSLLILVFSSMFRDMLWMQVVMGLSAGFLLVAALGTFYQYRELVQNTWTRYFGSVFYLFALIFALVHISNYDFSQQGVVWWQMPLLVVPQFLAGMTFGYVRISMGFLNAVALHAAYNAVFLLPAFWFSRNALP